MELAPATVVSVLQAQCAAILMLWLRVRWWDVRRFGPRGAPSWRNSTGAILAMILSAVMLFYSLQMLALDFPGKSISLVSSLTSSLATIGLCVLLVREQQWSNDLSDLVTLYLAASITWDVIYLTVPVKTARPAQLLHASLARFIFYCAIFITKLCTKSSVLGTMGRHKAPEEAFGVLNRVFFMWIHPILRVGYHSMLVTEDTPPLAPDMKPEATRKAMIQAWSLRVKPETKFSLPAALFQCLRKPCLDAIIPRLFLIVFRYSQPILLRDCVQYITVYPARSETGRGYWLVLSAIIIYVGIAVSTAVYQNRLNRLKLMTRSAIMGVVFDKTMKLPSLSYDNGEATTLMSTDADTLDGIAEMLHEMWAQVVEVMIGIVLLAREVGWIWLLPLVLIYCCSHMSRYVAKHLQSRQKAWNVAAQDRIALTSSMLGAIKDIKLLGLQGEIASRIQALRADELSAASRLRWVTVYYNASANALGIFSPALTLVIYSAIAVAWGGNLNTETAFTTMAILTMITHPANMVMTIVPRVVAALAGFERIQSFLVRQPLPANLGTTTTSKDRSSGCMMEKVPAIEVDSVSIGGKESALDLKIFPATLTVISGSTGSGKSTLLRAILGEVTPSSGSIRIASKEIAYCAQRPWLPNATIREAICGAALDGNALNEDKEIWYREVTKRCCLIDDFGVLSAGDMTQLGSRGLNLSGGQRQRVALARALFARRPILLLDDTFSALDGQTEQQVFNNLFGPSGLLRQLKTTVVLTSHSSQYFRIADHVVVLANYQIVEQGPWAEIKAKTSYVKKFASGNSSKEHGEVLAGFAKLNTQLRIKDETKSDLARQTGDMSLYLYYFSCIHSKNIVLFVGCTAIYAFFITIPKYWLQLWTADKGQNNTFYVSGFLFLSFMSWSSTCTQVWSVAIRLAPQSGLLLHERLVRVVSNATLTLFYETDSGSLLNRFSQDIELIDKQLPTAVQSVVTQVCKLIVQIALLCVVEKWLVISVPACMIVVYVVQKVYLRTSRQLRFLELEARSDVFSSFLESVEGLETIRAFGWTKNAIQTNFLRVETSQRPEYLLLCLQRWLNIVLDLLSAALATIIITTAVGFRGRINGAQIGIALNIMLVTNTTLLKLVENWTQLEVSLGAIARLRRLEKLTELEDLDTSCSEPPENWPSQGTIRFDKVTASYRAGVNALQGVSFEVNAGQKLVICGRTGSGKSTLILALFRLLDLQSGKITLDGINVKQVRPDVLRKRCFITVSQDPLLLMKETLRFNLDPEHSASDDTIIEALAKVGLWSHFLPPNGRQSSPPESAIALGSGAILDQPLSHFRQLSTGQSQLFAICRAVAKAGSLPRPEVKPILVLDEVTSSLDPATEDTVLRLVNDEFTRNGHTVVIVAHRLGALKNYLESGRDIVAVMKDGALKELNRDVSRQTLTRLQKG